jgi:hypothetical protein
MFLELTIYQKNSLPITRTFSIDPLIEYLPLLNTVLAIHTVDVYPALILSVDARQKTELINLLVALCDDKGFLTGAFTSDLIDRAEIYLQRAAVEHDRAVNETGLVDALVARIGISDSSYTDLLGRIPMEKSTKEKLAGMTGAERIAAACVLAMQDGATEVVGLLTDTDAIVRSAAADCVAFNREALEISRLLPRKKNGFTIESYRQVQEQIEMRKMLMSSLEVLPQELRNWRTTLLDDSSPTLSRGMRDWIAEQHYTERTIRCQTNNATSQAARLTPPLL